VKPESNSTITITPQSLRKRNPLPDLYTTKPAAANTSSENNNDDWINERIRKLLAAEDAGKNVFSGGSSFIGSFGESNPFEKTGMSEKIAADSSKNAAPEHAKVQRTTSEVKGKIAKLLKSSSRNVVLSKSDQKERGILIIVVICCYL
jgi:hypothetical protein